MLSKLFAVILSFGAMVSGAAQTPVAKIAKPPGTTRLYLLDCGMVNVEPEGVTRYHVTQAEVVESRMPVPCFFVAHPKGTLLWDAGVIPDALVEKAAPKPALYDINAVMHAVVSRTLKSHLAPLGYATADITYVAASHAHKDHTANLNDSAALYLPGGTSVVCAARGACGVTNSAAGGPAIHATSRAGPS